MCASHFLKSVVVQSQRTTGKPWPGNRAFIQPFLPAVALERASVVDAIIFVDANDELVLN